MHQGRASDTPKKMKPKRRAIKKEESGEADSRGPNNCKQSNEGQVLMAKIQERTIANAFGKVRNTSSKSHQRINPKGQYYCRGTNLGEP